MDASCVDERPGGELFEPAALDRAACVALERAKARETTLTTAESCTGGLVAALLTDQPGLGKFFDRGFVVYTEEAKSDLLGVRSETIAHHGVVSEEVARAMAKGAIANSLAGAAVGITGFAGPAGPDDEPGLVHVAVARRGGAVLHREFHFGDIGRDETRNRTAAAALAMLAEALE